MTLPNFLIVGAAKSGTSALYTYLKQHPQVFMTVRKELRYFSYTGAAPASVPNIYIHPSVTSLEEYKDHFATVTNELAVGESSPMYLYTPGTAERIRAVLPNVRMIAILRNPVERAYSAYLHGVREWREPARDFSEGLALEEERIRAGWGMLWHYKKSGLYHEQLVRYYNVFPEAQLKVTLYDDLVLTPHALMRDLFAFLGVEPTFIPDMTERPNATGVPRSYFLHKLSQALFSTQNPIKSISQAVLPKAVRRKILHLVRTKNLKRQNMLPEIRNYLSQYYQEDILHLQDLLNRDLSAWLNDKNSN